MVLQKLPFTFQLCGTEAQVKVFSAQISREIEQLTNCKHFSDGRYQICIVGNFYKAFTSAIMKPQHEKVCDKCPTDISSATDGEFVNGVEKECDNVKQLIRPLSPSWKALKWALDFPSFVIYYLYRRALKTHFSRIIKCISRNPY